MRSLAKKKRSKYGISDGIIWGTGYLRLKQFATPGIVLTTGLNAGTAVAQGTASSITTAPPVGVENMALAVRERGAVILDRIPQFPGDVARTLNQVDPGGGMGWLWSAVLLGVVMIGIGYLSSVMFHRWGREHYRYLYNPNPVHRREKIGYIFLRAVTGFIGISLCGLVACIGIFLVFSNDSAGRMTAFAMLGAFLAARLVGTFLVGLLAHDSSNHRLLPLSDADAIGLHRALMASATVTVIAIATCWWMKALKLSPDAHIVAVIGAMLLVTILFSATAFLHRQTVASLIYPPGEDSTTGRAMGRFVVSRTWHVMAIVYFIVAWAVGSSRLLVGHENALGLIDAPIAALCIGLALYGFALWVIDKIFGDPQTRQLPPQAPATDITKIAETEIDDSDPDERDPLAPVTEQLSFRDLASHVAAIGITLAGAVMLLRVWGVDLSGDAARSGWNIALILFLAYIALKAIRIGIDRKIAEEGGSEAGEPGEEGTGTAASRLATLLPLFRNFILFTIAVIAGLIVLSEIGLNIAPLFAGAGVIGLAVGFGAQTLIRDIFSGAFFLLDDAFRTGEYIDVGVVKGTVERISVRSLQLRHHRGALHTIPFGEISHLTNYARDWVIMKLPFRLTYDTDVEKVRKLIKKLGVRLLDDPEIGDKFVQPLKSQGVFSMEDSAMIMRVKFMTKPGDQFTVRKTVYAEIRALFEKEGIKFAHRQVSVRVADLEPGQPLTAGQKEAIAGAALPEIESELAGGANGGENNGR